MVKKILVLVIIVLVLAALGVGTFLLPTDKKTDNVQQVKQSKLQIIDKLLPATSYEPRGDNPYTHVMIHFVSNAVANPENPHDVNTVYNIFKDEQISSHYYIDREGTIYRFVKESNKAYHAGSSAGSLPGFPDLDKKLNSYSIGIELAGIGTAAEMEFFGIDAETYARIPKDAIGFKDAQYSSLRELLDNIVERHNINYDRRHIVGHDEYVPELRSDPGELFDWTRIDLSDT